MSRDYRTEIENLRERIRAGGGEAYLAASEDHSEKVAEKYDGATISDADAEVLLDFSDRMDLIRPRIAGADEATADTGRDDRPSVDVSHVTDIPHIDPTDAERDHARTFYGPVKTPDEGPVPDPDYRLDIDVTVTVPEWALDAVRWRLSGIDDPDENDPEEFLHEYIFLREEYVTPDGEPVADAVLDD